MKKELPKVYVNPIDHDLRNNEEISFHSNIKPIINNEINISKKITEIFASSTHVYKSKVHIITDNDEFDTIIVGKTNNELLTLNGEKIAIDNIKNIEKY